MTDEPTPDDIEPIHHIEYYDPISGQVVQTMSLEAEDESAAICKAWRFANSLYDFSCKIDVRIA